MYAVIRHPDTDRLAVAKVGGKLWARVRRPDGSPNPYYTIIGQYATRDVAESVRRGESRADTGTRRAAT